MISLLHCLVASLSIFSSYLLHAQDLILTGKFSSQEFLTATQWEPVKVRLTNKQYRDLKRLSSDIQIEIFVGAWCSDSQKWVPVFMYLEKALDLNSVTYILVDEDKNDPDGLSQKAGISHVPTFIFLRNAHEIGRIIETPDHANFTKHFLKIVQSP
jgi:hypothetical protein